MNGNLQGCCAGHQSDCAGTPAPSQEGTATVAGEAVVCCGSKAFIFVQTISFLGLHISVAGLQPDPAKIEAIRTWPLYFSTRRDVQRVLGVASYYRNFSPGVAGAGASWTELL